MLTNFFSNSKPVTSVTILALFFCYVTAGFFNGFIDGLNFSAMFWFLVLFGLVNFIKSRNNLTFDNSFFFLIFVILLGYFPQTVKIDTLFYSNLILLIYVRRVYSLQSSKNTIKKLFDSGFWMGISVLVTPFSIVLFPLTFLSILMHQHIDYRRLLTPVLGFIAPIIIFYTYHFWFNNEHLFHELLEITTSYDFSIYNNTAYIYTLSILFVITFISFIIKTPKVLSIKNTFRKNWILVSLHLLSAFILLLILKNRTETEISFLFFPCAIIITNGFELIQKKWYADILLLFFFVGSLVPYFL